jgi:transcriptional regulator with XRE-family HTH domain
MKPSRRISKAEKLLEQKLKARAARVPKRIVHTRGDEIRARRLLQGLTQRELAKESHVSYHKIIDIEKGRGAEPKCLKLVGEKLGMTLKEMAVRGRKGINAFPEDALLDGSCEAEFSGEESEEAARRLMHEVAALLNKAQRLIEYLNSRKTNSMKIDFSATAYAHMKLVDLFAQGRLTNLTISETNRASIYRLHVQKDVLDWPLERTLPYRGSKAFSARRRYLGDPPPRRAISTVRSTIERYVRKGALTVQNHADGAITVFRRGRQRSTPKVPASL